MKRICFFLLVILSYATITAQCYEPNLRKADAAYESGNVIEAYNAYRNATKCPDAARFENGKAAKEGMRKCMPSLTIDGNRNDFTIHVGPEAGSKRLSVGCKNLPGGWTAFARSRTWVSVEKIEYYVDISWTANNGRDERKMVVDVWGLYHPSGTVEREITIIQAGKTRNLLVDGNENYTTEAPHTPYTKSFRITSKNAWEYKVADADTAWISATKESGNLAVTLAANMGMPARTGSIVVSSGGEKSVITIKQAADPKFREEDYAGQAYMAIKDIEFGNDFDGNNSVGNPLYTDNITWLNIYIRYDGRTVSTRNVDSVYCKIYGPDGKLRSGPSSPRGYSFRNSISVKSGSDQRSHLWGWGNGTGNYYNESGEYRCEIWYRGKMLFSKKLVLKNTGPVFTKIDFVPTDAEGKEIGEAGNTFKAEEVVYLKPRVHYNYDGPTLKGKMYNINITSGSGYVASRTVLVNGQKKKVDSILYKDYIAELEPGEGKTLTLRPFSFPDFKNMPGVYTFRLLAGTKNVQASARLIITSASYNYYEVTLPPSAGAGVYTINTTSKTGQYSIDIEGEHYEYSQGKGRLTTEFPRLANIAVDRMTDTSFVVRYLSDSRYFCRLTFKNDVETDVIDFNTDGEEVRRFRSRQGKLPIETVRGIKVDLVHVERGSVVLGKTFDIKTDPRYDDYDYYLPYIYNAKGFYIMRYPVSQKLWKEIMGAPPALGWTKKEGKGDNYPAYNISLQEAQLFVSKLNAKTGMKFAMPNSSEWEYAMRGGINAAKWGMDDCYCPDPFGKYHEWVYNGWNDTYITHKREYPSTLYSKDCRDCITALRLIVRIDE